MYDLFSLLNDDFEFYVCKANTIVPSERFEKIKQHASEMGVFNESNAVLRAFGITILMDSNRIVIGVRTSPRIRFANNQILVPNPERVCRIYIIIFLGT